jgi:hypothetical protein
MPDLATGFGMYSADRAADAQVDAANAASATQLGMFNQTRKDNMPWMQAGQGGLNSLMGLMNFQQGSDGSWTQSTDPNAYKTYLQRDPGYQVRMTEGLKALENSAAARGNLLSGNTLKDITRFGQDYASNEFGNAYNRLAGLSGTGQATGQYLGGLRSELGNQVGNNTMTAGAARASGYMGQYNVMNNSINQILQMAGMFSGGG